MGNLQAFLVLAGACWISLLANMLGLFLKRFNLTRTLGLVIQWQAFFLYLLSLSATIALVWHLVATSKDWIVIVLLIAVSTAVPLVAVTWQFHGLVRERMKSRATTAG
jgi:membrane associated rhomboid family serine protease